MSAHAVTVRLRHVAMRKADWQRTHDLRIGPTPSYVDRNGSARNRVLIEPPLALEMRRRALELRRLQSPRHAARADMAVATAGQIAFGAAVQRLFLDLPADTQDRTILAVASRTAERFSCNLVGAVIHLDESAPHAHLTFESRSRLDGKLFSKIVQGAALQTISAGAVAEFEPRIGRGRRPPPGPAAPRRSASRNRGPETGARQARPVGRRVRAAARRTRSTSGRVRRLFASSSRMGSGGGTGLSRLTSNSARSNGRNSTRNAPGWPRPESIRRRASISSRSRLRPDPGADPLARECS